MGNPTGDGGKRAVLRGEHEISRKTIAQGVPGVPVNLYTRVRSTYDLLHTRPRVQRAPGTSLRPRYLEGGTNSKTRTHSAAGTRLLVVSSCLKIEWVQMAELVMAPG